MSASPACPSRRVAWDGLSLFVPAAWEPARLGRGYMLLEDASGPRLELRWQRVGAGFAPEKALRRLARKKQLGPGGEPGAAARAMLDALPPECRAVPCVPRVNAPGGQGAYGGESAWGGQGAQDGQSRDWVLFLSPDAGMAVVAAPHSRPENAGAQQAPDWGRMAASLTCQEPGQPGLLALYDIKAQVPRGFKLADFSINLGHYQIHYRNGRDCLDFSRFAPAEVILRDKALKAWATEVFAPTLGRKRRWMTGDLEGKEAVASGGYRLPGPVGALRAAFSRMYAPAKWRLAMAWRPDPSKILAVSASHSGGLDPQTFEEICRKYVVVQTS